MNNGTKEYWCGQCSGRKSDHGTDFSREACPHYKPNSGRSKERAAASAATTIITQDNQSSTTTAAAIATSSRTVGRGPDLKAVGVVENASGQKVGYLSLIPVVARATTPVYRRWGGSGI